MRERERMRERENERMRVVKNKKTVHVPKWKVCVSQKGKRPFLRSLRLCFLGARLFLDGASLGFQSLLVCLLGPLFPASNAPKSQREREKKKCVCVCVCRVYQNNVHVASNFFFSCPIPAA